MLPPPKKFSGGFSDRDIKRFSSPDLPDPHHHAPPLATTVVTSIPPPSSTPSPSSSHHSPHPPPHRNRHQHQYHLHHHGCHAANTIITTHARHAPPPPCSHLEGALGFSASTAQKGAVWVVIAQKGGYGYQQIRVGALWVSMNNQHDGGLDSATRQSGGGDVFVVGMVCVDSVTKEKGTEGCSSCAVKTVVSGQNSNRVCWFFNERGVGFVLTVATTTRGCCGWQPPHIHHKRGLVLSYSGSKRGCYVGSARVGAFAVDMSQPNRVRLRAFHTRSKAAFGFTSIKE
ncbi:hypothetical protein Tco_0398285 [Tanacetum coccineum]